MENQKKNRKQVIISVLIGIVVCAGVSMFLVWKLRTPLMPDPIEVQTVIPKEVSIKAGFAIMTNGIFRDFSDPKYHNQSPDVYIDSSNVNIVNIKKDGITWQDFFSTLPMTVAKDCLRTGTGQLFCNGTDGRLVFYLNGEIVDNVLERQIENGDRLLITYGRLTEGVIRNQYLRVPIPD